MNELRPKTFSLITIGCKTNQSESDTIARKLSGYGFVHIKPVLGTGHDPAQLPDYIIINTCTVTAATDSKVRHALRTARKSSPGSLIIVTGCYTVFNEKTLKELGADHVFFNIEKDKIIAFLREETALQSSSLELKRANAASPVHARSRAFVKIQDGCQQGCMYCIVPRVRGPYMSTKAEDVIYEINYLVCQGYEEIVLTGIHIGKYGIDIPEDGLTINSLSGLLNEIIAKTDIRRIRLSSIEINEVDEELIDIIVKSKGRIARHLHIPLQSGSDRVLAEMGRKYDAGFYSTIAESIKRKIPGITFTTDIITGFPGETEEDFFMTLELLKRMDFSKTHVFKFSPRAKTAAAEMKLQVDEKTKKDRSRLARELGDKLRQEYVRSNAGQILEIVFEENNEKTGIASGTSENYIKVYFKHGLKDYCTEKSKILRIRTVAPYKDGLFGVLI